MFEAYKIGIKISMINHVSAGLLAMARDFTQTQREADRLERKIKSIQGLMLKGGAMVAGSAAIVGILKAPYEEAKKLEQARVDFQNLNLSLLDNQKVYGQAADLSHKRLGSTITENIKLIQDLHTATGDLSKSLGLSDAYAQFSVAARVQNGGRDVDNLVTNSIKALEHRGDKVLQSPVATADELNRQSQVFFATKGRVSPSDYFHMSQTGKMAYTLADADFLYGPMAAYMQAKTGATAGTAHMTMLSSLVGGHMTKKAVGFMRELGLWEDQTSPLVAKMRKDMGKDPEVQKIVAAMGDVPIQSGGMPAFAAAMAAGNADRFVREILVPAIRKKHGNLSDEQIGLLLTQQFNRNTADDLSFWVLNHQKVEKDSNLINGSKGFSDAYQAYLKSPEGAEEAAGAAWKNFLAMFGSVYLPKITEGLTKLAGALDSMSKFAEQNGTAIKAFAYSLGLVAIGLGLRGGSLLLSAAFRGLAEALTFAGAGGAVAKATAAFTGLRNVIFSMLGNPQFLALAGAYYAGDYAGQVINDHLSQDQKDSIGRTIAKTLAFFGNKEAQDALDREDKYVRSHQQTGKKQGDVYLDGKQVGKVITPHVTNEQTKAASRPTNGITGHDGRLSPQAVGVSGSW